MPRAAAVLACAVAFAGVAGCGQGKIEVPQQDTALHHGAILFNAEIHRWDEVRYGEALSKQALREIRQHPTYLLKVAAWNTIRIFHLGELGLAVQNLDNTDIPAVPAWFEILGFYPLGLLALGGLATRRARSAPAWVWCVPLLLLSTVFVTGFIRFRSAIDPFLAILAALAVVSLVDRRRRRRPAQMADKPAAPPSVRERDDDQHDDDDADDAGADHDRTLSGPELGLRPIACVPALGG